MFDWTSTLERVGSGETLDEATMAGAMESMMGGDAPAEMVRRFLAELYRRGETPAELAAAARALRRRMIRLAPNRSPLLDTCGTGGDRSGTFNISTAAAIVVAACGVAVAKHGNRSATSASGSADVLEALGIQIDLEPAEVARAIEDLGIGFCFAPRFHPAMRHVAAVRRQLPHPTLFNCLGPLANPASAPMQLIGVGQPKLAPKLAETAARLGTRHALILHGEDGLDEITTAAPTRVWEVRDGAVLPVARWCPEDFGIERQSWASACVGSAQQSAALIREVLAGEHGVARELVLLNAAAALALARHDTSKAARCDAYRKAASAIDSGAAKRLLDAWVEVSRR